MVEQPGWNEEKLFAALTEWCTPAGVAAARRLYDYAQERGAEFLWNPGPMAMVTAKFSLGGKLRSVFGLGEAAKHVGVFWVNFEYLVGKDGPDQALTALAAQLREIPGVAARFAEAGLEQYAFKKRPSLSLDQILAQPGAVDLIEAALDQFAQTVSNTSDIRDRSSASSLSRTPQQRVVKITIGQDSRLWEQCLAEERVRIPGWDAVGDLRAFATQDDFLTSFRLNYSNGAATGNNLWSLRHLQPGDLVVANRDQATILGVGKVIAPGYEWLPDSGHVAHSVRVRWDTQQSGAIPYQPTWNRTIMFIPPETWARLATQLDTHTPPAEPAGLLQHVSFEDLLRALQVQGLAFAPEVVANYLLALQTKRFVILTGISGTGKTQLALAVARAFQPRVRVTRPADVPAGAYQFSVPQNFNRVGNLTIVLPDEFAAGVVLPPPDTAQGSSTIAVQYPQGRTALKIYREPQRNVTLLFMKGGFGEWCRENMQPGETILIEALDEENGVSSLRFSLPRIELHEEVLDNLLVTAVRPDWTDNRGLLGYYNPLLSDYAPTPFLHLVLRAQEEALTAAREGRPARPFFAILDEMNLARVEHYFSDFLSALESEQALHLHADAQVAQGETGSGTAIPRELAIPDNLFFTGTVNVDETTYMFSPKVLDRAFTLEFNRVDLRTFGSDIDDIPYSLAAPIGEGSPPAENTDATTLELSGFPGALVYGGKASMADWEQFGLLVDGRLRRMVIALHDLLATENRHFGYRVANEIARFVMLASEQAGDDDAMLMSALDLAFLQKVLPKFHGTQQELEPLLTALFDFAAHGLQESQPMASEQIIGGWRLGRDGRLTAVGTATATNPALPRTAAKVWGMLRRLRQQGFASFIE